MYNSGRKQERLKQQALADWRPLNARLKSLVYYFDSGNYFVRYYSDGYGSWIYLSRPIECTIPKANPNVNARSSVVTNAPL